MGSSDGVRDAKLSQDVGVVYEFALRESRKVWTNECKTAEKGPRFNNK
jgi:hypothetical protein